MTFSTQNIVMVVIIGLLGIGLYGVLISRNLIKVVVGLQVAVKGAMIAFVLAGRLNGKVDLGQSMALTVIVADTIVAVVALALAVQVRRKFGTLDIKSLTTLRR
ncbi:MAG: NADH-quinone oxidoreductase subunit K [Anaerolineae bacterium]|nr:NADH-quinone oxidoreductase subunit K [Anaerolineae bacterium]